MRGGEKGGEGHLEDKDKSVGDDDGAALVHPTLQEGSRGRVEVEEVSRGRVEVEEGSRGRVEVEEGEGVVRGRGGGEGMVRGRGAGRTRWCSGVEVE